MTDADHQESGSPGDQPLRFCLDCDYPLDQLNNGRCPECGKLFDLRDPMTYRCELSTPVKLHACRDAMEAHFLCGLLDEAGVLGTILGEALAMAQGEIPPTVETLPAVWVGAYDLHKAMKVVEKFVKTGMGKNEPVGDPWPCPKCGEQIEAQFSSCWNCQAQRPDVDD